MRWPNNINGKATLPWTKSYSVEIFLQDAGAALIVSLMLVPQCLAYAMIAGVPAEVGLYASILPLIIYALMGSSRHLSVGPVALIALITATSLKDIVAQSSVSYVAAASCLAFLSGLMLLLMGVLRLGHLTHFLSHSVISGFMSASALVIAFSQLAHCFGLDSNGGTLLQMIPALVKQLPHTHTATLLLSLLSLIFLLFAKYFAAMSMQWLGLSHKYSRLLARLAPIFLVLASIAITYFLQLQRAGVDIVGYVPAGLALPTIALPSLTLIQHLSLPAFLIALIGYVESIAIAKTLAAKQRQQVSANQELLALGAANIAAGVAGAIPVSGGFSRSAINYEAGAKTQVASILAAMMVALVAIFFTPFLFYLPKAILAVTIIVAVASFINVAILRNTWRFARSDFYAVVCTIVATLLWGVEEGLACGVAISIFLHLYHTSVPHIAEVGLVEGTEHFRNVLRYRVKTVPRIISLRLDESLYFASAEYLEERILKVAVRAEPVAHIILQCCAVNEVDYSALEILESINQRLSEHGITLHLSEVKGPVMDVLEKSGFLNHLTGGVFLSHFEAYQCVKRMDNPMTLKAIS